MTTSLNSSSIVSPILNSNGSITFNYMDFNAKTVFLASDITDWETNKKLMKNNNGLFTITIRPKDMEFLLKYKFIVDGNWILDPLNSKTLNNNSLYFKPSFSGRNVILSGTIQSVIDDSVWSLNSSKSKLNYDGYGLYSLTIFNVPSNVYEYKIAINSWNENYGLNGIYNGDNIELYVQRPVDITFFYNDDNHKTVTSLDYKMITPTLYGDSIPYFGIVLSDPNFENIFSIEHTFNFGVYDSLYILVNNEKLFVPPFTIYNSTSVIKIFYDPISNIVFSNFPYKTINTSNILFDSKKLDFKKPFGAIKTDETLHLNIQTLKDDLNVVKLVLIYPNGFKSQINMKKNSNFGYDIYDTYDKWSCSITFSDVGIYSYYFMLSNNFTVIYYGDDNNPLGTGISQNIYSIKQYNLTVYNKNFLTPNWFKNGIIYQIFPDRFFNGNIDNDKAQLLSRGSTLYTYHTDWYSIPENPVLEYSFDHYNSKILNPYYGGFIGNGNWGSDIYGGDLSGISYKLSYLKALGISVIYLNPILKSISNHRYDTSNYSLIDSILGNLNDFKNLCKNAYDLGIRIILDGVFNHVSDDSIYFDRYGKYISPNKPLGAYCYYSKIYDLMNNNNLSYENAEKETIKYFNAINITDFHYKDWFTIKNNKVVDPDTNVLYYEYEGWNSYCSLPVIRSLNGSEYNIETWHNEVIDGDNSISKYWIDNGASGWRLDVSNELSDETLEYFRNIIKSIDKNNVIIGEIWTDASPYLLGNMYDSVMNYRFRNIILDFILNYKNSNETIYELDLIKEEYPKEAYYSMMNLVGSHDTQRIISAMDGAKKSVYGISPPASDSAKKLVLLIATIQMTYPGVPSIYYGDEVGLCGSDDPDCRRAFPWGCGDKNQLYYFSKLTSLRNNNEILRLGEIFHLYSNNHNILLYLRTTENNNAIIVSNRSNKDINGFLILLNQVSDSTIFTDVLNESLPKYTLKNHHFLIDIPAFTSIVLMENYSLKKVETDLLESAFNPNYLVPEIIEATSFSISESSIDLNVEDLFKFETTILPNETSSKTIIWSSSDNSIATIDSSGNLKAISSGNVTILAILKRGCLSAKCLVTVS